MDASVYYGQYSLEYWIQLMMSENVKCPPYQRSFVWDEEAVYTLVQSIKDGFFVPPVTIGVFKESKHGREITDKVNYIIDGQQRLTSLLLAYIGVFPDFSKKTPVEEEIDGVEEDSMYEWQFSELFSLGKTKEDIYTNAIKSGCYKELSTPCTKEFLESNYLGYSYVVPNISDKQEQQAYYSKLFKNLNTLGTPLTVQQSRQSLYFLKEELSKWFAPDFCRQIFIKSSGVRRRYLDFVRYLSILSQYYTNPDKLVLAGCGRALKNKKKKEIEDFYEDYIYSVVNKQNQDVYGDFEKMFGDRYLIRIEKLEKLVQDLGLSSLLYTSVVDFDLVFFGLIYFVVFEDRKINISKKEELVTELIKEFEEIKRETKNYTKDAGKVGKIRERMNRSITIYTQYVLNGK